MKDAYPGILRSEMFGLPALVAPQVQAMLDKKREIAAKETLSPEDKTELARLNEELGTIDMSSQVRDPLYRPFVRAMSQLQSPEERADQVLDATELARIDARATAVLEAFHKLAGKEADE